MRNLGWQMFLNNYQFKVIKPEYVPSIFTGPDNPPSKGCIIIQHEHDETDKQGYPDLHKEWMRQV